MEAAEAIKRAKQGWGSSPETARRGALFIFGAGLLFGPLFCWGFGLFLLRDFDFAQRHALFGLLLLVILFAGGLYLPFTFGKQARDLWRYWHTWRQQPQELVVLEGWLRWLGRQAILRPCDLVQVHLPDGTQKLFLVRSRWLDHLGEEDLLVRLTYVVGTEQVIHLEVRSPQPGLPAS